MIRINLLSEGRRPVVARKKRPTISIGDQDPSLFFLGGGVTIGVLICGVWWMDLTLQQEGPVHIMDRVSRALPDLLWINTMNFRGKSVDLNGTAYNTNAIASFIENLDNVPEFHEPDTKDISRGGGGGTYNFRISFRFRQRTPEEAEAGAAAAAPATAAAPAAAAAP